MLENRGIATRGFGLFVLVGMLALSSLGDQGCSIRFGGPPPPPPGTGQGAPGGVPGAPGTTNPPQVAILVSTTAEVSGYAVDTANPSTTNITVDLLPATAATSPTAGISVTAPAPLMASVTANVSGGIVGLTYPGHGFKFVLTGQTNPALAVGQAVIARANNGGQIQSSAAATLIAPTGTTSPTTNVSP